LRNPANKQTNKTITDENVTSLAGVIT